MAQAPLLLDIDPYIFRDHNFVQPVSTLADNDELLPNHARTQQQDDQAVATEELGPNASIQQLDDDQAASKERNAQLIRFYQPLHKAALSGDWESAERFFIQNGSSEAHITQRVNVAGMTILHVAANMGHEVFIHKLLRSGIFPKIALKLQDHKFGLTPLHYAAAFGSLSAVKDLISEDNSLTQVQDNLGFTPLFIAASKAASKKVIWYLINKTTDDPPGCGPFSGVRGARLIASLVGSGYYDICLSLFNRYPQLASDSVNDWGTINCSIIGCLVDRPSEFPSGSKLNFWERCIYHLIPNEAPVSISSDSGAPQPQQLSTISTRIRPKLGKVIHWILGAALKATVYVPGFKHIRDEKYKHNCIIKLLNVACITMSQLAANDIATYFHKTGRHYTAASNGQIEIIRAFIEHFPHIMDDSNVETNIVLCAIRARRESVLNFMIGRGATDKFGSVFVNRTTKENRLHIAAKLASYTRLSSVSCPSLQMQRELQWFQGVEKLVYPSYKILRNKEGQTPREMFTTEHKDLVRDAEKWMKDTANSCMVVSTLIATVVFAAAFTIPGGNIEGIGIPIFLNRSDFMVFVASDAVGMFSSATSIIMFLSILTARYAEDDFLYALPKRLILGLASLFIAIASMMVAFGSALYMVLNQKFKWILFPIIGLTSVPVSLFVMLQLPLFIYMVRSTYGPSLIKAKKTSR